MHGSTGTKVTGSLLTNEQHNMKIDFSEPFSFEDIDLVSIWDISFVFAFDIFFDNSIPSTIKLKIKKDDFDELTEELTEKLKEGLLPLQQWMSEQIIKDIELGILEAKIISKSIDGKIKPKKSVVENLSGWAETRSIPLGAAYDDFVLSSEIAWDNVSVRIDEMSKSIHWHINDVMYEMDPIPYSEDIGIERDELDIENKGLRKKIKKLKRLGSQNKQPDRRGEHHSKNREQVLGAALSVLSNFPEQCRNIQGKVEATKVRELIDAKAPLFWEEVNEPPLSIEGIERLIREWINKTGK